MHHTQSFKHKHSKLDLLRQVGRMSIRHCRTNQRDEGVAFDAFSDDLQAVYKTETFMPYLEKNSYFL